MIVPERCVATLRGAGGRHRASVRTEGQSVIAFGHEALPLRQAH
jgi:hypothetical protein